MTVTRVPPIKVNAHALRQRILDSRLSDREIGAESGISYTALRSIANDGAIGSSTTLADVSRLLGCLGMSWAELFDESPVELPESDEDDDATLAQLLHVEENLIRPHLAATAAGWTLNRLYAAKERLGAHLGPVGLQVHENGMGMALRVADQRANDVITTYQQIAASVDGGNSACMRVLYNIYANTYSKTVTSNRDRVPLATLHNRRMITINSGDDKNRRELTADVAYAFDVTPR